MAFTTPKSWSTSNVLTATDLNTYVRDNISWLATDKPTCRAKRTSVQSIANSTLTAIQFDAEDWDSASMHSTSSNTSRITVPSGGGGKYAIGWYWYWATNTTGRRVMRVNKNGSLLLEIENYKDASVGTCTPNGLIFDTAVAGDYYEVIAFQTSGGALNVDGVSVPAYFFVTWYST